MGRSGRNSPAYWRDTLLSHRKNFLTGARTMGGEHSGESPFESMELALCGHDIM